MRLSKTIAPIAAGALLASGCGSASRQSGASENYPPRPDAPSTQTTSSNESNYWSDMSSMLNRFRNGVIVQHQARIVMDTCVAWGNDSGGTTVTLNPGIASSEGQEYYIFSSHDSRYNPSWGPLNGPEFLSPDAEIVVMGQSPIIDAKTIRKLSKREMTDEAGNSYFEEDRTHQPVLETALVPKKLSVAGLKRACVDLLDHRQIDVSVQPTT